MVRQSERGCKDSLGVQDEPQHQSILELTAGAGSRDREETQSQTQEPHHFLFPHDRLARRQQRATPRSLLYIARIDGSCCRRQSMMTQDGSRGGLIKKSGALLLISCELALRKSVRGAETLLLAPSASIHRRSKSKISLSIVTCKPLDARTVHSDSLCCLCVRKLKSRKRKRGKERRGMQGAWEEGSEGRSLVAISLHKSSMQSVIMQSVFPFCRLMIPRPQPQSA